ncbi:MAG: hypothetical protein WBX25_36645 [Rhodomicrobium sp.]
MTNRQLELRDFIRQYIREHEIPPTQMRMAEALRTSQGSITWLLMKLEAHGEIQRGRGWRSVRLSEPRHLQAA